LRKVSLSLSLSLFSVFGRAWRTPPFKTRQFNSSSDSTGESSSFLLFRTH
jgi:hypothetical protein